MFIGREDKDRKRAYGFRLEVARSVFKSDFFRGLSIGVLANNVGAFQGVQVGLLNFVQDLTCRMQDCYGILIGGLNLVEKPMRSKYESKKSEAKLAQIGVLYNGLYWPYSKERPSYALQLSLENEAGSEEKRALRTTQIGLVNILRGEARGIQIGLLNYRDFGVRLPIPGIRIS